MMVRLIVIARVVVVVALLVGSSDSSVPCTLDDAGSTPGECVHIRNCKFHIGRLRVGATVKACANKGDVCCPTKPTIAEKKCEEWKEMLLAPISFDQPRPKEPVCANNLPPGFVVGGRDAKPFEYPHSVPLGYGTSEQSLKFLCGATLISEQYLLTAAHCVTNKQHGKPSYAVIGDRVLDAAKMPGSTYRKVVRIAQHTVHPEYKPPVVYNDIALLRLSTPLELDRYVLPACISTPFTAPKKQNTVEVTGWGITDVSTQTTSNILQAANISTIDTSSCNEFYGGQPDKPFRYPQGIVKSQICATGNEKDTCNGDSGGGLFTRQDQCLFHILGITSLGSKICGYGNPSVYTNVAAYQDWIESIVFGAGSRGR